MLTLPDEYNTLCTTFQPLFSKRLWPLALVLLVGAILAPGKRTVTAVLRIMGLSQEQHFQNFHRVLNRAVWSNLALSASLLPVLLHTFLPQGPVVIGIDETIERDMRHYVPNEVDLLVSRIPSGPDVTSESLAQMIGRQSSLPKRNDFDESISQQ